jgi:cation transport regulator
MGISPNHGSGSADPETLIWIKPRLKAMRFPPVGTGAFTAMPYATNDELPPRIRRHLPRHAQDIFRESFNSAWRTYGAREPDRREEIANRVAWAAVKMSYRKVGDDWVPHG